MEEKNQPGQYKRKRSAGRPKGRRYVTTAFSLPTDLAEALEKAIEKSGMGKSEFIRQLISEKLGMGE